jgi:hypothetical protein
MGSTGPCRHVEVTTLRELRSTGLSLLKITNAAAKLWQPVLGPLLQGAHCHGYQTCVVRRLYEPRRRRQTSKKLLGWGNWKMIMNGECTLGCGSKLGAFRYRIREPGDGLCLSSKWRKHGFVNAPRSRWCRWQWTRPHAETLYYNGKYMCHLH